MRVVIYLHGFRSSPKSAKGQALREHFAEKCTFLAPDLNVGPKEAQRIMLDTVAGFDPKDICLVGSSMGGFYAAWLAEKIGCKAVLLNPAVTPWVFLKDYIGTSHICPNGDTLTIIPEFGDALCAMATQPNDASRYLVYLSTADEVLDWTQANRHHELLRRILLEGENHQIMDFETCIPEIDRFFSD